MPHASGLVVGREVRVYFHGATHGDKLVGVCTGENVLAEDDKWPTLPKKGDVWRVKITGFAEGFWFGIPIELEAEGTTHTQAPRRAVPARRTSSAPVSTPRRREIVTFRLGRESKVITSIDRKISFPCDRGRWTMEWPKPNERWEVEIVGETGNKRAYILAPVRKLDG